MKKINKAVVACMLCYLTMLSGCNSISTDNQSQNVLYQENTKNIVFSWWGGDVRNRYTLNAIDYFENSNKDISVQCKYGVWAGYSRKQNIFMKSHEEPDVMMINYDWLSLYSSDGDGFYDMYQLGDDIELSNYTANVLKYGEINGRLNAIPIAFNTQTFYYNKNLLDRYGIETPETWNDMFAAAEVLSKDDIYLYSISDKALFFCAVRVFGADNRQSYGCKW